MPRHSYNRLVPLVGLVILALSSNWSTSSSFRTSKQQLLTATSRRESPNEHSQAKLVSASHKTSKVNQTNIASNSFRTNVTSVSSNSSRTNVNSAASNSTIYIITQLQGEWGNHLNKISVGKVIQLYLRDKHGLHNTQLIIRLQSGHPDKWGKIVPVLKECFPVMREWDFTQGFEAKFEELRKQARNFTSVYFGKETNLDVMNETEFSKLMDDAASMLQSNDDHHVPRVIFVDKFLKPATHQFLMQHYRQELLDTIFRFSPECCLGMPTKPDPEETVVHLRNFEEELPVLSKTTIGYQEADPQAMSTKLLGHLKAGDKVAIVGPLGKGRFRTDAASDGKNGMSAYEQILTGRGLQLRLVASEKFVHDFCFLKDSRKEFIGSKSSTFVTFAAYFGNTSSVVLYNIGDSDEEPKSMQPPMSPLFPSSEVYRRRFQTRIISKTPR